MGLWVNIAIAVSLSIAIIIYIISIKFFSEKYWVFISKCYFVAATLFIAVQPVSAYMLSINFIYSLLLYFYSQFLFAPIFVAHTILKIKAYKYTTSIERLLWLGFILFFVSPYLPISGILYYSLSIITLLFAVTMSILRIIHFINATRIERLWWLSFMLFFASSYTILPISVTGAREELIRNLLFSLHIIILLFIITMSILRIIYFIMRKIKKT